MNNWRLTTILPVIALAAPLAFAPAASVAQPAPAQPQATAQPYQPQRGQPGKDVMWIGTPENFIDLMLDTAKLTKDDTVVDLGSGDGRLTIAAAKRGAKAVGIEFNPKMVEFARQEAAKAGVAATFIEGDFFKTDFSYATVVTLFLLDELNFALRPIILDMKPGTRIVSNTFHMGDWEADENIGKPAPNCGAYCSGFMWLVPAKVQGEWQTAEGPLALTQTFQMLKGTLGTGGSQRSVSGKLAGSALTLEIGNEIYTGSVNGNSLTLASKDGARRLEAKRP